MKKILLGLPIAAALLLGACGSDDTTKEKASASAEKESAEKDVKKSEHTNGSVYFKNKEAKLDDLTIKITDTKVIPVGKKGNEYGKKPVIAFWYETTNHSDKEIDPSTAWIAVFKAIQDNNPNSVNEIEMAGLPDDAFLDSQLENIKKDGTVKNAVAYSLDDNETPVTLIASQGIGGQKLGELEISIK